MGVTLIGTLVVGSNVGEGRDLGPGVTKAVVVFVAGILSTATGPQRLLQLAGVSLPFCMPCLNALPHISSRHRRVSPWSPS